MVHFQIFKVNLPLDASHTTAIAAVDAANKSKAAAIVVLTTSGHSAHLISKYRPRSPIIALTRNVQVARQCHIYRGILPLFYNGKYIDLFSIQQENMPLSKKFSSSVFFHSTQNHNETSVND